MIFKAFIKNPGKHTPKIQKADVAIKYLTKSSK